MGLGLDILVFLADRLHPLLVLLLLLTALALDSLSQFQLEHLKVRVLGQALVELGQSGVNTSSQVCIELDGYILRRQDLKYLRLVVVQRLRTDLAGAVVLRAGSERVVLGHRVGVGFFEVVMLAAH